MGGWDSIVKRALLKIYVVEYLNKYNSIKELKEDIKEYMSSSPQELPLQALTEPCLY
jgi:hypothetical protein